MMPETTDMQLVREFVRSRCDRSFAELVRRHAGLVHAVALRHVQNPDDARDVAQAVFLVLARRAPALRDKPSLAGWLHEAARLTSARFVRTRLRRGAREREAGRECHAADASVEPDPWDQLSPHLDAALASLPELDRQLLVLRFLENRTAAESAGLLQIGESAAFKRTQRALEKLRRVLRRRGVPIATAGLEATLASLPQPTAPAPIDIGVNPVSESVRWLGERTLRAMAWARAKTVVFAGLTGTSAVALLLVIRGPLVPDPPADPALASAVLAAAFGRVTARMPPAVHFIAEVEEVARPWTEQQVWNAVDQEDTRDARERGQSALADPGRDELRALRAESYRFAHLPRRFLKEEWLAGVRWRLDAEELTLKPEALRKAEPRHDPAFRSDWRFLAPARLTATNDPSWIMIDHRLRTLTARPGAVHREALWEAFTLEPRVGFLLVIALVPMESMSSPASVQRAGIDSFAGRVMDPEALARIVAGRHPRWFVETGTTVDDASALRVVRLKGRALSLAHGLELVLSVDPARPADIRRAEVRFGVWSRARYVSVREEFDATGFPRRWSVETPDSDPVRRTIRFREVEWGAAFDPEAVFSTVPPPGYAVNGL